MSAAPLAAVTGAGRGIGRGIALRLAADGYDVLVIDRDADAASAVAAEVVATGRAGIVAVLDVRDRDAFAAGVAAGTAEHGGRLDVFVNNAGYTELADPLQITETQWDAIMSVNARGCLFGMQIAAEHLADGGRIVNTSSATARGPYLPSAHYAASKAAVLSLTMTFASALAARRIRVNAVAPAIVDTDLWDGFDLAIARRDHLRPGEAKADRIAQIPIGRAGTPSDVASVVAFLVDPANGFITGECIDLTGGSSMR